MNSENQLFYSDHKRNITIWVKREDLLHPFISGNKFRKLKYNLSDALSSGHRTLLTFGGAFSNHLAATAFAGQQAGFNTVAIVRGEELAERSDVNPTLSFARECGMKLFYVSREEYRRRSEDSYIEKLQATHGPFYLLPEGGTNPAAVRGCEEILGAEDASFDYVCCPVGTGGTIAGIINSSLPKQNILGFPALKGMFLYDEIRKFANNGNWQLITDYHFGGYGKVTKELVIFMNGFLQRYHIPLDPVYTGKMFFGVMDMIRNDYFPENSRILLIHTGGLQGIAGMNAVLQNKQLPTINTHD